MDISPRYQMKLINEINKAIREEYASFRDILHYIEKWHVVQDEWNNYWENFKIIFKENGDIFLSETLQNLDGDTLIKIAIDMGVNTPDFIPCIASFRNDIKSDYKTASATFEKAFKQIEESPETAVGLANSALESIIKEIFKDERIKTKPKDGKTLYDLTSDLLKEFHLFPKAEIPLEIKTIGSSLLSINKAIEKIRSEQTFFHGKTSEDYIIDDSVYTYFIVNAVTTVGLFLNSFYKKKFPKPTTVHSDPLDDLPF